MLTQSNALSAALPRHFAHEVAEGRWFFTGNRLQCELVQKIPGFGKIKFIHQHVQSEKTVLDSWVRPSEKEQTANLYVLPPLWQNSDPKEKLLLKKVLLEPTHKLIEMDSHVTQSVLAYLSEGYTARFKFNSHIDNLIMLDLTGNHFQKAYRSFTACEHEFNKFHFRRSKTYNDLFSCEWKKIRRRRY